MMGQDPLNNRVRVTIKVVGLQRYGYKHDEYVASTSFVEGTSKNSGHLLVSIAAEKVSRLMDQTLKSEATTPEGMDYDED